MTRRKGKPDVREIVDRVEEITPETHDLAVQAVLRWAARNKNGPTVALDMCKSLGLDMRAALIRARVKRKAKDQCPR